MKQLKITVITPKGVTECCGWFKDMAFGEAYAERKLNAGCIVLKQYKKVNV